MLKWRDMRLAYLARELIAMSLYQNKLTSPKQIEEFVAAIVSPRKNNRACKYTRYRQSQLIRPFVAFKFQIQDREIGLTW